MGLVILEIKTGVFVRNLVMIIHDLVFADRQDTSLRVLGEFMNKPVQLSLL